MLPPASRRQFLASGLALVPALVRGQTGGDKPDTIRIPARAVTRGPKHHFFGYYDKTPWDRTGRYLLAHEVDFAAREPEQGEALTVGMVDLSDGDRFIPLDTTTAWSWQQGAMLQWLGSAPDREVVYNGVADGKYVAIVRDVRTGKTRTLPRPIYTVSPDGRQSVTLDFARSDRLRPGYGYKPVPEEHRGDPAPDALGLYRLDVASGANELVLSLKRLAANKVDARMTDADHGVEHPTFNTDGTRVAFFHRWRSGVKPWLSRVYTVKPDGTDLRLHLDTGYASHFDWRDPHTLLIWAQAPTGRKNFLTIDTRTDEIAVVGNGVLTTDGHCSYSPDRKWVLNDTYPDKNREQWLMLFDPKTGRRYDLNRFRSPKQFAGPVRCDLHPRWDRTGTQVCVDSAHDPHRQVYVLDVSEIVKG